MIFLSVYSDISYVFLDGRTWPFNVSFDFLFNCISKPIKKSWPVIVILQLNSPFLEDVSHTLYN